jgi:hypothetical protein
MGLMFVCFFREYIAAVLLDKLFCDPTMMGYNDGQYFVECTSDQMWVWQWN